MYKESAGKICSVFGGEGKRKAERRERETLPKAEKYM